VSVEARHQAARGGGEAMDGDPIRVGGEAMCSAPARGGGEALGGTPACGGGAEEEVRWQRRRLEGGGRWRAAQWLVAVESGGWHQRTTRTEDCECGVGGPSGARVHDVSAGDARGTSDHKSVCDDGPS
jgi:hypothetical protein